jgi:hypothetical protein|tara:strand:- start:25 stop:714 length:690 start_codon:yes stop_codon:yes gene_type:complete
MAELATTQLVNEPLVTNHFTRQNFVQDPKALLVLAHGAGADMNHEFMETITSQLNLHQINVIRFNFPFMQKRAEDGKRRPPDRMPKLIDCFLSLLSTIDSQLPLFIAGKSMGGRVAATLMNESIAGCLFPYINGGICLGYPFHPQKKPEKLRLEPLQDNQKKLLIVQGDRDTLGNKDEIARYDISTLCEVLFLSDGDHNLKPRVKSGFTPQQHIETTIQAIVGFIDANS